MIDRYEIGERQTSACAAPTAWLENLGLGASIRQTFSDLVVHVPKRTVTWPMRCFKKSPLSRHRRASWH